MLPEILGPDGPWIFVSWPALVLGAALGIICTVLSAFRPAARAGKVSPVEAIASVSGGSTKKKTIRGKSTKWMPIEAAIAFRQIGMRKRSFLLTAVSLSFGILLLLSFSPLTNFIQLGLRNNADLGDVYAAMPVGQSSFSDAQLSSMKSIAGVASVSAQRITQVKATFRYDLLGSNYRENKASWKSVAKDNNGMIQTQTPSTMVGMSNENIRNLKADVLYGSMDPAKLNSENGIILMLNMMSKSSVNVGDLRPGNTIQVQGKNMKIGAIVMANTALQYYAGNTFISFYTTNQVFQQFSAARPNMAALTLHSGVNGNNVYTTLKRQLSTVPKVQVGNQQLAKQLSGRISLVSNILFYGFIAIILLIGVLNIINTIGTNVLVRTREIGLLRAGGMTIKQVRNMLVYESACYGVLALGIGLVVGLPLERFFYRNMVQLTFGVPWSLPWVLMIVVSVVTIAAVFLSLVSPLKQMRQMEITRAVTIE
ncbi:MAG TPA: hypothetical protein DEP42_07140 [Ruminococcaceae bacterium]|nr:hypothetical protein [Oscillospiraceae bacterium]